MGNQTAMQMAISHYKKLSELGSNQAYVVYKFLEENFLEVEKQQIFDAFEYGDYNIDLPDGSWEQKFKSPEHYYEETYGDKNDVNEKYGELINEAYQNYRKIEFERIMSQKHGEYLMSKEEFINKCKTDKEFSQKWGLKIEERELSEKERYELVRVNGLCPKYAFEIEDGKPVPNKLSENEWYDKYDIPTRAITLTYNNETTEIYE